MKKQTKIIIKNHIYIIFCIIAYMVITNITGIGCPIRRIIGIPCPACGITRSWLCVLKMDFEGAISFHPLFWFIPMYVLIMLHSNTKHIEKIPKWVYRLFVFIGATLILYIYIYRMVNGFGDV